MSSLISADAYVIIIGAMKAGTSSLFSMLAQHPLICPSTTKEPEYFSERFGSDLPAARYEDLFDYDPDLHHWCLEASTGYTKFPAERGVPERMKESGISPRFIYCVRDPFQRIESHYNFGHLNHKSWAPDEILNPHAARVSMYYLQLREYLAHYPDRNRYFIVDFDEIVARPVSLANELFEWLGIKRLDMEKPQAKNVTPSPSRLEHALARIPHSWGSLVPASIRTRARQLLRRVDVSAKRQLSPGEREKLRKWLQTDMQRFGETFDFPIQKWGFTAL